MFGQEESTVSLFRLDDEGGGASRTRVRLGRASVNTIEVLEGLGNAVPTAGDVEVAAWPVSVREAQARPLEARPCWRLPVARLTAFIAFRLSVPVPGVDDVRMTLRLPAEGMPADRIYHVLRDLLDSPEKFLRFALRPTVPAWDSDSAPPGMRQGARAGAPRSPSRDWQWRPCCCPCPGRPRRLVSQG